MVAKLLDILKKNPWEDIEGSNSEKESKKEQKYDKIIKEILKNSDDKNSGGGNGGDPFDDFIKKISSSPKKILGLGFLIIIFLWLLTGFYKVDSDENALVLYFGKYYKISTPGLNYRIPFPVGKIIKQPVLAVNSEEFGYASSSKKSRLSGKNSDNSQSLMLTGDENIVDIEFQVQWQIADIEKFTFNIAKQRESIRKAAESSMREVIAKTPISEALSDGKSKIEQASKQLLQEILDSYGAGVRVVLVQLRRVDPPPQVIDAFRDVQTAKADKERAINEAEAYSNDIIPRARGNAAEMEQKSLAYKEQVEAAAKGEASRFLALLNQYRRAKDLTRKRIYLETMQDVYKDIDKVIIGEKTAKGALLPYFPINEIQKTK